MKKFNNNIIVTILAVFLVLVGSFGMYKIVLAAAGDGTGTINVDGGAQGAGVTVVQGTSHIFKAVLTIASSGITLGAISPTFQIPAGFTAPNGHAVATAGGVNTDGQWSVVAGGPGGCTVDSTPGSSTTVASGQTITVDITADCAATNTITLTYQGTSASTMSATQLVISTSDGGQPVVPLTTAPGSPTITVTAASATLTLVKTITNDNGGARPLADFQLTATGPTTITGVSATGPVTGATVTAGTYTLSEVTHSDYTAGLWTCTNSITVTSSQITLAAGNNTTCTINNNDIAPVLHLRKTVILDNGGSALNTDWTLTANGALGLPTNLTGTTPVDSIGTFKADTYILGENSGPSNYTASLYSCVKNGAGPVLSNSITLALGDTATCTITNDDIASGVTPSSSINVVKVVINDSGGTKIISDFKLFVNGIPVASGMPNTYASNTLYTVTETSDPGYTATFSGDCDSTGHLTLPAGVSKVCIITNNDIGAPVVPPVPPLIDVVKVPSPLSLPGGPGPVTYTYTLKNIGTVPVTNITMIGDTCSPIILVSGDSNNNTKLDVNETWTYTCSTILSATHTNIVTTTGWANNLMATDIASATVVVGASIVPPLINVTKVPSPLTLSAGGGMVTYTETVTNPGTVALGNVHLADDKCAPVTYVSGDTNNNSLLDTSETWIYNCRTKLTKTTVNTATASGDANGLTARDFAIATVVVAAPKLPNTGIAPAGTEKNVLWDIVALAGILVLISTSLFAVSRLR